MRKIASNQAGPVLIIGAGRSGTNILRDILTQIPNYGTWPCDEINYIWRHGNTRCPTDEFTPEQATPAVQRFIRRAFDRIAAQQQIKIVVEKTCANSLRVGFVDRIFPDARYIFIVRDGRDAVASAMKRWTEPQALSYILPKMRYVPVQDIPFYAVRQIRNRLFRLTSQEKRLAFWGPRFVGMEQFSRDHSLAQICAMQWVRCVEKASNDLAAFDSRRVSELKYEQLAHEPIGTMTELSRFLGIHLAEGEIVSIVQKVSASSVGKWQNDLSPKDLSEILPIIQPTLDRFGY